jgi:hypothetical protein
MAQPPLTRSKLVAIATGAISFLLGVAYLLLVQFLDFRGEMVPAPIEIDDGSALQSEAINLQRPTAIAAPNLPSNPAETSSLN